MSFTLRKATVDDIPGILNVWFKSFNNPGILSIFPDSPAGRGWIHDSISRDFTYPANNTVYMILTDDTKKGEIVSYAKWIIHPGGGPVPDWESRWGKELPEEMNLEMVSGAFFEPMARQHATVTENRPHYFLEVLGTHEDYRKRGLGSRLLTWGCEAADAAGQECYLDAAATAKGLYEKFGYVHIEGVDDPKAFAVPLLRTAKTE